jgi:hypothetical protein
MKALRLFTLIAAISTCGLTHATWGDPDKLTTADLDSQVSALETAWDYYKGNRESREALQALRRQLAKFQTMGYKSQIQKLDSISDDEFQKAVDKKMELALDVKNPRECSLVVMTLVALSQGLCAKRPEAPLVERPQIHVTGSR